MIVEGIWRRERGREREENVTGLLVKTLLSPNVYHTTALSYWTLPTCLFLGPSLILTLRLFLPLSTIAVVKLQSINRHSIRALPMIFDFSTQNGCYKLSFYQAILKMWFRAYLFRGICNISNTWHWWLPPEIYKLSSQHLLQMHFEELCNASNCIQSAKIASNIVVVGLTAKW